MARGRGGKRDGAVGKAYANRTDLGGANVVAAQPSNQPGKKMEAQAASGQAYGAAGAQLAAQKALPITNPGQPAPAMQQGQPPVAPPTPLDQATDHGLPLHTGMDIGGGAGSEAMIPSLNQNLTMTALGLLDSLGEDVSPQVSMIKNYLRAQANNGIMQ